MSYKENKSQELLTGVLIGVAVGAVAGLFLAPKAGRNVAEDLLNGTNNFIKRAKSSFNTEDEESPYWLGGILGALLGGASGVVLSPKSTQAVREYISDSYQKISDKTWDLINNLNVKGEEITDLVKNQTSEWSEKTLTLAEGVTDEVREWAAQLKDAALEAREKAEQSGNSAYQHKIAEVLEWSEKAIEIADEVTCEVKSWREAIRSLTRSCSHGESPKGAHHGACRRSAAPAVDNGQTISQFVEWATIGLNIWQNLQQQRK